MTGAPTRQANSSLGYAVQSVQQISSLQRGPSFPFTYILQTLFFFLACCLFHDPTFSYPVNTDFSVLLISKKRKKKLTHHNLNSRVLHSVNYCHTTAHIQTYDHYYFTNYKQWHQTVYRSCVLAEALSISYHPCFTFCLK